jgi:hypothetical protein
VWSALNKEADDNTLNRVRAVIHSADKSPHTTRQLIAGMKCSRCGILSVGFWSFPGQAEAHLVFKTDRNASSISLYEGDTKLDEAHCTGPQSGP